MGNSPVKLDSSTVPVIRYTVEVDVRYKGRFKTYEYVSKEYGISVCPFNSQDPVHSYDPERFKGVANEQKTVYVKRLLLQQCKDFLERKEFIINEIQKALDVG
jgi:hypothetical protein